MTDEKEPDVESLIERLNAGDSTAARELFPLVLEDLHRRARRVMRRQPANEAHSIDTLALNEALERMEVEHPLWERIVRLRYYGGASEEQVAEALGISVRSVQRHWNAARALLRSQLG